MSHIFTGTIEKDLEWTIKTFRSILKKLKPRNLNETPLSFSLSEDRNCVLLGLSDCIISIKQAIFPDPSTTGLFTLYYDTETEMFFLLIQLNLNMYDNDCEDFKIQRKMTRVHEFLHCLAALMSLSRLETPKLKKLFLERLNKASHYSTIDEMFQAQNELSEQSEKEQIYPDEHYRLGFENFPISYPPVFEEFLLSWTLIEEYLTTKIKEKIVENLKTGNSENITEILLTLTQKISTEKSLDVKFVKKRIFSTKFLLLLSDSIIALI